MTTYGFEAEFANNANAVLAELHDRGLAGDRSLHNYHCDCDNCSFNNGMAFRGQTDSSCSGEIISDVFGHDGSPYGIATYDGPALMGQLAEVAVEVDAEPGANSGFHVHVGTSGMSYTGQQDALWQFLRWEHVLTRIAGGRWSERRDGQNRTVRDCLANAWVDYSGCDRFTAGAMLSFEESENVHGLRNTKRALLDQHLASDRHSNLNIQQRIHPTWEFRLWNSTRSAWRMEMFTGLSVALVNPDVLHDLSELSPPTRMSRPSTGIDSVALALSNNGFEHVADLLARQGHYLNDRAATAPAVLTAL